MKKLKDNISYLRKDLPRVLLLLWNADRITALINFSLQMVQAFLPVASLYFIKALIESLEHHLQFGHIIPILLAFGAIQLLLALAARYASYINTVHQQTLTDYLAAKVLNKAIDVEYAYYENPEYHDTLHLAQQQSLYKATMLLNNFNSLLQSCLSMVFLILFFFSLHSLFALLFMLLSIPLAIINWYSGYALIRLERDFAPLEREANYLHQTLTGISYAKEVRVFGFGLPFIDKFNNIRHHIHQQKKQLHLRYTWYSLAAEAVEIVAMILIFGIMAKYAFDKVITIGVFVIYIQGFQRLQGTSKSFMQAWIQIFQQKIFLKDLFTFFDIKTSRKETASASFPNAGQGLAIRGLSFTYPQTDRQVLNNISVACRPGEIIAIVGANGSGKSTLVKLLARLYTQYDGSIDIDGENISNIRDRDFRKDTIFLFQDFEKYFFSIEENIALGDELNPQVSEAVKQAAILAGAHDFIIKLSNGYKTRMGRMFKSSEQISGGQWQKLALARLFYKNPRLIVLDEPTSALDATAEFELFDNIQKNLKDQMVILITHRLYNLKMANRIYVLQDGAVAEEGSFDELCNAGTIFKRMYQSQKL